MSHIASPRQHGFGKGFLKDHADAIEKCGRLPGDMNQANFVQVPSRDVVKSSRSPVVRVTTGNGIFRNIHGSIDGFPTSKSSDQKGISHNNHGQNTGFPTSESSDLAYSTGMGILHLDEEITPEYVYLANRDVSQENMAAPEGNSHGLRYVRALTYPEPRVLTAPKKRHASSGTDSRQIFKKFC